MKFKKLSVLFQIILSSIVIQSVSAKPIVEVCKSNKVDCEDILYANKLIGPAYDFKTAKEELKNLGWDKNNTWLLNSELGKNGFGAIVDAQAILSKKEVNGKMYYLFDFRGTDSLIDWDTNFNVAQVKFDKDTKVHQGFLDYSNAIISLDKTQEFFKEILNKQSNGKQYEIITTGHSLGGAAAQIFSASLQSKGIPKNKIKTIVFGAPAPGSKEFADRYLSNVIQVKNDFDFIPGSTSDLNSKYYKNYGKVVEVPIPNKSLYEDYKKYLDESKSLNPFVSANASANLIRIEIESHKQYEEVFEKLTNDQYITSITDKSRDYWIEKDLRNQIMQAQLTEITLGGSSHIGSAAYFIGRSPSEDNLSTQDAIKVQQFSGAENFSIQQKAEYTDGFILKAPVDIVLDWNQSIAAGQLDLDSHLTGPSVIGNDDTSTRFHTYFDAKGSLNSAPNALLYKDVIPSTGASGQEQTRIQILNGGIYRFYVHDFTNKNNFNSSALSNSGASVTFYNNGIELPTPGQNLGNPVGGAINVPTGQVGNVWYVFQLDTRTGILQRVNVPFINESDPAKVPRIAE